MGEAWHDRRGGFLGLVHQGELDFLQQILQGVDLRAQPEPYIGGNLVVAGAAGMQALAGISDNGGEPLLYVQVHVLGIDRPGEATRADFSQDLPHTRFN